jgi:tight adherence protein C
VSGGPFAFVAVLAGVFLVGQLVSSRFGAGRGRTARRVRDVSGPADADAETEAQVDWVRRRVSSTGTWLDRTFGGRSADLRARLALAGSEKPSALATFHVVRVVLVAVLGLALVAVATARRESWGRTVVYALGGGLGGFLLPGAFLGSLARRRQRRVRNALPDALDMMVLCVEGGGSLNASVTWVADEIGGVHPDLGREMRLIQREMQLGLSAGEAFAAFAERVAIPETRDLAAAILQTEKYGASVGKMLRSYSESARQDRQLWAEEVAQKAAVKILFPMLLCIFPAMFIVILGPAAMQMSKLFIK